MNLVRIVTVSLSRERRLHGCRHPIGATASAGEGTGFPGVDAAKRFAAVQLDVFGLYGRIELIDAAGRILSVGTPSPGSGNNRRWVWDR
jgi:hypothetical protein